MAEQNLEIEYESGWDRLRNGNRRFSLRVRWIENGNVHLATTHVEAECSPKLSKHYDRVAESGAPDLPTLLVLTMIREAVAQGVGRQLAEPEPEPHRLVSQDRFDPEKSITFSVRSVLADPEFGNRLVVLTSELPRVCDEIEAQIKSQATDAEREAAKQHALNLLETLPDVRVREPVKLSTRYVSPQDEKRKAKPGEKLYEAEYPIDLIALRDFARERNQEFVDWFYKERSYDLDELVEISALLSFMIDVAPLHYAVEGSGARPESRALYLLAAWIGSKLIRAILLAAEGAYSDATLLVRAAEEASNLQLFISADTTGQRAQDWYDGKQFWPAEVRNALGLGDAAREYYSHISKACHPNFRATLLHFDETDQHFVFTAGPRGKAVADWMIALIGQQLMAEIEILNSAMPSLIADGFGTSEAYRKAKGWLEVKRTEWKSEPPPES